MSVLIFRQTEFDERPFIPLMYMLYERKLQTTHDAFFRYLSAVCPEINIASNVIMVTDSEASITSAIATSFPNLKTSLCWNHIMQDAKRRLREHGISTADELKFYVDSVRSLFQQTSKQEYTTRY
jgi:MULE transposase domain